MITVQTSYNEDPKRYWPGLGLCNLWMIYLRGPGCRVGLFPITRA